MKLTTGNLKEAMLGEVLPELSELEVLHTNAAILKL